MSHPWPHFRRLLAGLLLLLLALGLTACTEDGEELSFDHWVMSRMTTQQIFEHKGEVIYEENLAEIVDLHEDVGRVPERALVPLYFTAEGDLMPVATLQGLTGDQRRATMHLFTWASHYEDSMELLVRHGRDLAGLPVLVPTDRVESMTISEEIIWLWNPYTVGVEIETIEKI